MGEIYENKGEYNSDEKLTLLIVFDDMIANMLCNKKLNPVVSELFIRRRILIYLIFIVQSSLAVPKN